MPRRLLLLNVLLVAVAVGAGAFIVSEVTTPPRPAPLRARTSPEATPPPTPGEKAPPASPGAYSVVASRNLFSPTRTEAPVSSQAGRQAAAMPKPTLHGVVLRDGTPVAYLEDPMTKRVAGYRLGDSVAGGIVKAINADHVVLNRPEGAVDVRLRDPAKPRPALPAPGQRETPPPGTPGAPGGLVRPQQPGITPGQPLQPGQVPIPPRRMLPPNVLRRVPPPAADATQ